MPSRDSAVPGPVAARVAVSVLVPVWNEEGSIGDVVVEALAACAAVGVPAECVVCVDRRGADRSAEAAATGGARVILQTGQGLTAAVLEAAEHATGPVAVVLDGDGQHDPAQVVDLVEPLLAGDADVVCGARSPDTLRDGYGSGASARWRHLGSVLFSRLAAAAVGTAAPDPLTGMFACRTQRLLALADDTRACPPRGYKPLPALLAATPGDRTACVTIGFAPRSGGVSHMNLRAAATLAGQLAHLAARRVRRTRRPSTCRDDSEHPSASWRHRLRALADRW